MSSHDTMKAAGRVDEQTGIEIAVTAMTLIPPDGWEHEAIRIEACGRLERGRFDWHADVWAIRKGGWVLDRAGDWQIEPQPSSRDDAFYARCRFTLSGAISLALRAADKHYAELRARSGT